MSERRQSKLAVLNKIESVYGDDALPTPAEALLMTDVSITPIEAEEVSRGLVLPYMGNQGVVLAGEHVSVEGSLEVAGSGVKGTPPKIGSALRVSGFAETVTVGQKVDYTIVEDDQESSSLHFIHDKVRHIGLGGRSNLSINLTPKQVPKFQWSYMGLLGTIADDAAMPAVTQAGWVTPVVVSKANTTMSLHGWSAVAESISINLGNRLTPRFLIGDEKVLISDRSVTGTVVVEARALQEIDWFDRARKRTRGPLSILVGTVEGNIVEITAPAVEIGRPTQGQTDGILNYSLPLSFVPVIGRDEIKITFR
ncbi:MULTISPECIES: phage tail tube protein [unclassified Ensifer]|uniref:phage tail tube protein n=1 Tax=unclassified Ensifer TaxID=2633371 RepID=UPI000813C5C9|nr:MULTISPECIES: phage tail tube protein [unclassified Ensifer]OCP17375.1 hypothetical protein BC361_07905 [Ensifer sp. LC54]OCP28720.1 hypothetical protein BC363_02455 [Ensifer sp. LC384]